MALTTATPSPLQLGLDMEELEEIEEDAGLGNGGLGRLAGKQVGRVAGEGWTEELLSARSLTPTSLQTPSLLSGLHGNAGPGCLRLWDPL